MSLCCEREEDSIDDAFSDFFLKMEAKLLGKVPLETEFDLDSNLGAAEFYLISLSDLNVILLLYRESYYPIM